MLFNFFYQMTCHLKQIVAVIFIVLLASCSGSKKYFKAAEKLEKQGIDHTSFAEHFITSGLVYNENVFWYGFHTDHDFAYL